MYRTIALLAATLFFAAAFSCSSDKKYGLENNLLDYQKGETITFTISGNAICSKCEEQELPVSMMQLEAFVKGDPVDRVALKMYDGLGSFSLEGLSAPKGSAMQVQGTLMIEGTDEYRTTYYGYSEVATPDDNGDVVSITLSFPSTEAESEN